MSRYESVERLEVRVESLEELATRLLIAIDALEKTEGLNLGGNEGMDNKGSKGKEQNQ